MNKAALMGVPVAAVMAGGVCWFFYSVNGGQWLWPVFFVLFALAWGIAINHGLRVKADETTIKGGTK